MVSALGHNVPRVFTHRVRRRLRCWPGSPGVIGGNYLTTESGMADAMGPIVFVVVVVRRPGLAGRLLHRVDPDGDGADLRGGDRLLVRRACCKPFGVTLAANDLLGEILTIPMSRIGPLLPYALMVLILVFRPRGLMGTRET